MPVSPAKGSSLVSCFFPGLLGRSRGRVENWRSGKSPISSSPSSNRTFSFPEYGFPVIFFQWLSIHLAFWHSSLRSSQIILEFIALPQSPLLSLLQKRDEGIAPSLFQGFVVLEMLSVLWATPTPLRTCWNFVSLYPSVAPIHRDIPKGLPCCSVWLPLRVAPATPEAHLSVMAVFVRTSVPAFPF